MTDDTAHKIQIAADLIADEMYKHGTPISLADCLTIARRLHERWERRQHHGMSDADRWPGEIAQRFRERYSD